MQSAASVSQTTTEPTSQLSDVEPDRYSKLGEDHGFFYEGVQTPSLNWESGPHHEWLRTETCDSSGNGTMPMTPLVIPPDSMLAAPQTISLPMVQEFDLIGVEDPIIGFTEDSGGNPSFDTSIGAAYHPSFQGSGSDELANPSQYGSRPLLPKSGAPAPPVDTVSWSSPKRAKKVKK